MQVYRFAFRIYDDEDAGSEVMECSIEAETETEAPDKIKFPFKKWLGAGLLVRRRCFATNLRAKDPLSAWTGTVASAPKAPMPSPFAYPRMSIDLSAC
jgi:hypothetical protein